MSKCYNHNLIQTTGLNKETFVYAPIQGLFGAKYVELPADSSELEQF